MKPTLHNDQAHIAEQFRISEDHTIQTARLAFFKINSYKLSMGNAAFRVSNDEFKAMIGNSLLNYIEPAIILSHLGFFSGDTDN